MHLIYIQYWTCAGNITSSQLIMTSCVTKNRTLPLLVWHRQNWNIVYPYMSLDEGDTLKHSYIAGFTDPAIETHEELYDVLVNGMCVLIMEATPLLCVCILYIVPAATITINPASKGNQ